jgi:hypothetical protein
MWRSHPGVPSKPELPSTGRNRDYNTPTHTERVREQCRIPSAFSRTSGSDVSVGPAPYNLAAFLAHAASGQSLRGTGGSGGITTSISIGKSMNPTWAHICMVRDNALQDIPGNQAYGDEDEAEE